MIIVADAGPLLHLFWVGALGWGLPPLPIHVVREVWLEVEAHAPEALQDARLLLQLAPALPPILEQWNLDAGERAALAYAASQQTAGEVLVLCDEREGRRACQELSLPVIGSIGLIVEAFRAGRVSREVAETALRDLPGRGRLHVRPELIESAVDALDS